MLTFTRNWIMAGLVALMVACGGSGGGNSAPGVEPGPPPPGQPVPPEPVPPGATAYSEAEQLNAVITSAEINENNQAVINFQLSDGNNVAITDLTSEDVRFVIAKLLVSPLGNLTGTWQSYVNAVASPQYGDGTEDRLQASYERDDGNHAFGEFINQGQGQYTYRFATDLASLPEDVQEQAAEEGLDVSYDPNLTHRISMQFDNNDADGWANPIYDWVPATGATDGVFNMDIAATANCNRCHDPLGAHGGGFGPRREVEYCVTCHNPGTTDPDSTNTVDMKVMIHKIHMGQNLPSVQEGGEYLIYGFRGSLHDYSTLAYPQDIRNCVNCHVGTGTVGDREDLVLTSQGDNWAEAPTAAACGSCHENVDFSMHAGGQPDDSRCAGCHDSAGIQSAHRIEVDEARETLLAEILGVDNTMRGQFPEVTFRVSNPLTEEPYDIRNDPIFANDDARLAVGIAWETADYNNAGNFDEDTSANNASQVQADALADAVPNGDGSYTVTLPVAIPDGSLPPGIEATGSGVATVEGHPSFDFGERDEDGNVVLVDVPVGDATEFFSIDEPDGDPVARRTSVTIEQCNTCHSSLVLHGSNRANNIDSCVSCHNARNTDLRQRITGIEQDRAQATDGKREESVDFKTMVHGIHAAAMREDPLQIIGFMAFNLFVYDEEHVHYPGNLANCTSCHTDGGFTLPLADGVLATTIDTGDDINDPSDDTVVTPVSAVCSSCHDSDDAAGHMTFYGGSFDTTQADIDSGEVREDCNSCHSEGSGVADAWEVHQRFLD